MKISVITRDVFLFQKIRLELRDIAECVFCDGGVSVSDSDATVRCIDEFPGDEGITMSRCEGADIALPFRIGELAAMFSDESAKRLTLCESTRCARLGGRTVRLTDAELALLAALLRRNGEFACREELLREVWGEDADPGVVNVYIHYLREKLEAGGEKVILSSRNQGYRINEKYVGRDAL